MFRRHCLFSSLIIDRLYTVGDVLTVDIPIKFEGDYKKASPIPIEFFLCKKSQAKSAMISNEHFKDFLTQVRAENLPVPAIPAGSRRVPDHLVALAESNQVAEHLIDR